jgi:hypothetical protein
MGPPMLDRRWHVVPMWRRILSATAWFTLIVAIVVLVIILLSR